MCEEETTSEPSSPPVESTAKEHDAGGATTVITDSESPLNQRNGQGLSLQKGTEPQEDLAGDVPVPLQGEEDCEVEGAHKKTSAVYAGGGQGDGSQGATAPSLQKVTAYMSPQGEKDRQVQGARKKMDIVYAGGGQGNGRQGVISATAPSLLKGPALQAEKDSELQGPHKKNAIVYASPGEGNGSLQEAISLQKGLAQQQVVPLQGEKVRQVQGQVSHTHTESAPPPAPQVQHLLAPPPAPQVQQQQQQQPKGFTDIWADNEDSGFDQMRQLLRDGKRKWYVAVDTEFCRKDDVVDPRGAPRSPNGHYEQTRRIVDEGDLVQVGFALADSGSGLDPDSFLVFQFNLLFQYTARSSTSKNIRFLRDTAKLNLDDHASRGINIKDFINGIRTSGILENTDITWVTFQGYSDFGYLIRALQDSSVLTQSRAEFIRVAKTYFRSSYDLKLLLSLGVRCQKPSLPGSGSLKGLAASLGVKRSGQEHGSGSDAHLTLGCFRHLMLSDRAAASELRCYKNIIYGVENPLPGTSGANGDADQVHVWASNFDREIGIITGSLDVQGLLTVEVRFTNSTVNEVISYAQARTDASHCKAHLALGFSDHSGRLAYGRIWIFHVQAQQGVEDEEEGRLGVTATMLAGLLTNMRTLQNTNVVWLSSTITCFLYLVSLLTRCLPLEEHSFFALWSCFFPNCRLIEHGSPEQDPGRRAIITLRQMLATLQFT